MCRIFRDALPPLALWTSFPHPLYPTLKGLMDRLNHLGNDYVQCEAANISIGLKVYYDRYYGNGTYKDHTTITKINPDGSYNTMSSLAIRVNDVPLAKLKQKVIHILPSLLFIENGEHTIEIYKEEYMLDDSEAGCRCYYGPYVGDYNIVNINIPISIIGESREHCIVMGGLLMNGKKEDDVNVSNLTLRKSRGSGVCGNNGASIHLDNVSVENSRSCGISLYSSKRNTMKNCNVSHSNGCGLRVMSGGLMTIDGNATTIHHNCTNGRNGNTFEGSNNYGLRNTGHYPFTNSSIHLVSPLTLETISQNNHGGGNYGGTFAIVDNEGTVIETIQEATEFDY